MVGYPKNGEGGLCRLGEGVYRLIKADRDKSDRPPTPLMC